MKTLVISNEPDTVRLLEIKLRKEGYQVVSARNGDQGLEHAREERLDETSSGAGWTVSRPHGR